MVKLFSKTILDSADELIEASRSLDYSGIINDDDAALSQLNAVLKRLSINQFDNDDLLDDYASKQAHASTAKAADTFAVDEAINPEQSAAIERQQQIADIISQEGLQDRLGKVYNSFANDRVLEFNNVPHQRGLPPFDLVFAADYSPLSGLHGIFISADEVMSIVLPSDAGGDTDWQVLKRRQYSNPDELMEFVTLLSAGFELP